MKESGIRQRLPLNEPKLLKLIEALLFVSTKPLSIKQLKQELVANYKIDQQAIRQAIEQLMSFYQGRGVQLVEVASGFRFQSAHELSDDLSQLMAQLTKERSPRYSRALLETLSLIAYKQPITRGEIEEVRGVAVSSHIMKSLLERNWVTVVGHKEVPGRPSLYATTKEFLDYFSLHSLDQLPELNEIFE